jgi:hypothetical protein
LLGGGVSGSSTGGGSGGNYIAFIEDVSTGSIIPYVAGKGGEYNGTISWTSSKVTINESLYEAHAGLGASTPQREADNNLGSTDYAKYFKALGQPGTANDYSFSFGPNGTTIQKIVYGSGGGTYPDFTFIPGGTRVKDFGSTLIFHITHCTFPITYGSGGAANNTLNARNNGLGGYVRIYY